MDQTTTSRFCQHSNNPPPLCSFVPPHFLKAVAESPEVPRQARESAARTLAIDNDIRQVRPARLEEAVRTTGGGVHQLPSLAVEGIVADFDTLSELLRPV